uniref:Uncharacterized protein n=2 Tax=Ditylum brightwellii TaxID=49249 RepID=A0A7S4QP99_9STRA
MSNNPEKSPIPSVHQAGAQFQIEPWTNVPNVTITRSDEGYPFYINPEFTCVAILNDTVYLGANRRNGAVPGSEEEGGNLFRIKARKGWNRETRPQHVSGFDISGPISYISKCPVPEKKDLIAVGMATMKDNIILYDVKREKVLCCLTHPMIPHDVSPDEKDWEKEQQQWGITALEWRKNTSDDLKDTINLYSTGGVEAACIQWDVEKGQEIRRFVLHHEKGGKGDTNTAKNKSPRKRRYQYEMHGIALPDALHLLVTSSHQRLYLWDERSPSEEGPVKIVDFYQGDSIGKNKSQRRRPLKHLGFTNDEKSILTIFGDRMEGCRSYIFPDMVPAFYPDKPKQGLDFVMPLQENIQQSPITAAYISPLCVFGTNVEGSLFVWNSSARGLPTEVKGTGNTVYFGYGANGIDYNETNGGIVAVSMGNSNPQSNTCGGVSYIWSIAECLDHDEKPLVPKSGKRLFETICNIQ